MKKFFYILVVLTLYVGCKQAIQVEENENVVAVDSYVWENATIYFMLTDRFYNGDPSNDLSLNRLDDASTLRGFEGGDLKGVLQKLKEGYFTDLGVTAIWMTPIVEQIKGGSDEGPGLAYAYHGYWTRDWTSIDPNWGTAEELHELVNEAHARGIRILLDGVINHTGPVTDLDPVWPDEWVRTEPQCTYTNYETTITCTLVKNLPDIKTESNADVALPPHLIEKWKAEGRYEQELKELDEFFERTGHPRAPRFYIMKWLADYITEFGIDGYRVDTVKHTEEYVWSEFREVCDYTFAAWKQDNPDKVVDNTDFYLVGEVYNYALSNGRNFSFGDKEVDFFDHGFNSLINFEFKSDAQNNYETIFNKYSKGLKNELKGVSIVNYVTSHDDGGPFDRNREKPYESANKLMLTPGAVQLYYGDEVANSLTSEHVGHDADLRKPIDWDMVENDENTRKILSHWQKLVSFRKAHPAIGVGNHKMLSKKPYTFKRAAIIKGTEDKVIVGLDLPIGVKNIDVSTEFEDGTQLRDAYSNTDITVTAGNVSLDTPFTVVLLEPIK